MGPVHSPGLLVAELVQVNVMVVAGLPGQTK